MHLLDKYWPWFAVGFPWGFIVGVLAGFALGVMIGYTMNRGVLCEGLW